MFSSKENQKRFTTICYTRRVGLLFRLFLGGCVLFCLIIFISFPFWVFVCCVFCDVIFFSPVSSRVHQPAKKADTVGVCVCGTLTAGSFEPRWAKHRALKAMGASVEKSNPKNCQIKTRFSISFSPCLILFFCEATTAPSSEAAVALCDHSTDHSSSSSLSLRKRGLCIDAVLTCVCCFFLIF